MLNNEDYEDLLPRFYFDVDYYVATAEIPEAQSTGTVGSTYSDVSFTINGVSNSYTSEYKLYVFNRDKYIKDNNLTNLTYTEFVAMFNVESDGEYKNKLFDDAETKATYFTEIVASDELAKDDSFYSKNKAYAWSSSSQTFVPQSSTEFYVIELALTESAALNPSADPVYTYMCVRASVKANSLEGENNWLENNVASIVLLCIAGVAFIGLIVLLIIKPKDKGDIDTIDSTEAKKGKKSKKSKTPKKA
jgi:hypothetical protein